MRIVVGELVAWYEYYACGTIVRDYGLGLVASGHNTYGTNIYQVLTHKGDVRQFSEMELDSYEEYMERQNKSKKADNS